jgi:hypothetical protein
MTTEPEEVDLRGKPKSVQLKAAMDAVARAATGASIHLLSDEEIILKALPLAAQSKGLRMKLSMPSEGVWSISLMPQITPMEHHASS